MTEYKMTGILKSEHTGKGAKIQFPTTEKAFKELLYDLSDGHPDTPWGISGICVQNEEEAFAIAACKNLSAINYYAALAQNFTRDEYALYQFLLRAGVCVKYTMDTIINLALNVHNFTVCAEIPDAYALGKMILDTSTEEEGKASEGFENASKDKIAMLGEMICIKSGGTFYNGFYIEPNDNYQLLYDSPADVPEFFRISIPV